LLRSATGGQRVFPVVDANDRILGVVTGEEIALLEADPGLALLVTTAEMMRRPLFVRPDDSLLSAFEMMRAEKVPELPVVDPDGRVLGFIDEATIAQAYLREHAPKPTAASH